LLPPPASGYLVPLPRKGEALARSANEAPDSGSIRSQPANDLRETADRRMRYSEDLVRRARTGRFVYWMNLANKMAEIDDLDHVSCSTSAAIFLPSVF